MNTTFPLACLVFILKIGTANAQTPKDATVPLTATVSTNPANITLNWENPTASTLLIQRRTKGQTGNQWVQLLSATNSTQNTLSDNNVAIGQTYEYRIARTTNIAAHGYAHVAVEAPVTDHRGTLLLLVDADLAVPLAAELERLRDDLSGDGWRIKEHFVDGTATVQSVKNLIVADFNTNPAEVRAVLLLGKIPVPYSGNSAWDGHSDHSGAWPADAYYADVDGTWTDIAVNNSSPTRAANKNVPGDGKFDQSIIPSAVELEVGRVDFRRLTMGTFGASTTDLLRRYLNKNHDWRTGAYTVEQKALVDDNFGYFSGEAFAANGFRNAYPLVGAANVSSADFFDDTHPQSYLMGYGTGPGTYTSAGGVGNSGNFANDTVNIVFSNIFGSYHGDWDYETNPLMPAALASRGGILTCAWAGRPHHFYQALASGETMGYCMKETQNAQFNNAYFNTFGRSGAHVALLGDPTVRAHIVAPPSNVSAVAACGKVSLEWKPSPDDDVVGYHIYRSKEKHGAYTRLTTEAIAATTFTDDNPSTDTLHYQVRAIKSQTSPGGGVYWNNSTGVRASVLSPSYTPPTVSIVSETNTLNCATPEITLTAFSDSTGAAFQWSGPNNFAASGQSVLIDTTGIYTVAATFPDGCVQFDEVSILGDYSIPVIPPFPDLVVDCNNPCVALHLPDFPEIEYYLDSVLLPGTSPFSLCAAGSYTLLAQSKLNGCSASQPLEITADTISPLISIAGIGLITCSSPTIALMATSSVPGTLYTWSGPGAFHSNASNVAITIPGTYFLMAVNPSNGCTTTTSIAIEGDGTLPDITAAGGSITCNNPTVQLAGGSSTPGSTFLWTGPSGFTSSLEDPSTTMPGTYLLTVTSPNGCSAQAAAMVTIDTIGPLVILEPYGQLDCEHPCVTAFFYQLFPELTADSVVVCEAGNYTYIATGPNGCTTTFPFEVTQAPTDGIVSITGTPESAPGANDGAIQLSIAGGNPPFTFLWSNGATSQHLLNIPGGTYSVIITDAGQCTYTASITVETLVSTLEALVFQQFALSPNPTDGRALLLIQLHRPALVRVTASDAAGRLLWAVPEATTSTLSLPIDLSAHTPGTYYISVVIGHQVFTRKMVVAR